jgi:2-dehydro-3-deoxygluconokinase
MTAPSPALGTVLCVGEPLIALAAEGQPLERATHLSVAEGGAELNVAVHLARLGFPVRFVSRVGNDPFGRRLRAVLEREGVEASMLVVDDELPTGLYVKGPTDEGTAVLYWRRESAATMLDRLPEGALRDVRHIHVTGILAAISDACRRLVAELLATPRPRTVSFDVNYRLGLWDPSVAAPVLLELAQQADFVFVGRD